MSTKTLLEKLVETKNSSKTNKARNKATSNHITTSFFAKFLKAKVDKKRSLEEIKDLVESGIDMDRDGCIGLSDLDAFVGRANYHQFFERVPPATINTQQTTSHPVYTIKRASMGPTEAQI
jgi:hypothetical protein